MEENGERKFGQRLGAEEGKGTGRRNLQLGIGRHGILTTSTFSPPPETGWKPTYYANSIFGQNWEFKV